MNSFGMVAAKREGDLVQYDNGSSHKNDPDRPVTSYVERCVPAHLEDEIHKLITEFLKSRGYDSDGDFL